MKAFVNVVMMTILFSSVFFAAAFAQNPVVASAPVAVSAPAQSGSGILDPMEPDYTPPAWLDTAIRMTISIPVVGPYIVVVMQWLGVIAAILTALCAFLLAMIKALSSVLSAAQLEKVAQFVASLEKSKLMYWLKRLSIFNAQKEDKK